MPRILGLDFGTRRIGAALSDPRGQIASPLEVYERRTPALDAQHYQRLVEDEGVDRLVVGLPLHTSGREGELAELCRRFGFWLGQAVNRPLFFYDERYTSVEADVALRSGGLKARDRKARRDMIAAQILLQSYLDAGCPTETAPGLPLQDSAEDRDPL